MNYEELWLLLKRTVETDYEIFGEESSRYEFHRGAFHEAQTVIRRMNELEDELA